MCGIIFARPTCSCPPFPIPHTRRKPSYFFCHRAIQLAKQHPYHINGLTAFLPKICEERRPIYREWGRECPGCAARSFEAMQAERKGRMRLQAIRKWGSEEGRARAWERSGWESREREVGELRKRWDGGGSNGGLRGRER
jgi:hypothetical protein